MIRYLKSRRRSSRKKSKSRRRSKKRVSKCRSRLSKKIAININEYKLGRYKSPSQAKAVAYSQIKKKYPQCTNKL